MAEPSEDEATSAGSPEALTQEAEELVSLAAELSHLGDAVNAATLLSQAVAEEAFSTAEATAQAPAAITAVLVLVRNRLLQVRRALKGAEDPSVIRTSHNATCEPKPGDDPDVVLRPWTPAERAAHHARKQAEAEWDEKHKRRVPGQGE